MKILKFFTKTAIFSTFIFNVASAHTLLVLGHPNSDKSLANKTIVETVKQELPDVEVLDLGKTYPTYEIDVEKEQARIKKADVIVFQYPIWWYAPPAIFKNWQEQTFTFGFAHDAKGGMLNDKKLILSMTSGAPESDYHYGKRMNASMEMLQIDLVHMAALCGMQLSNMVYTGGYNLANKDKQKDIQIQKAKLHAKRLIDAIKALDK